MLLTGRQAGSVRTVDGGVVGGGGDLRQPRVGLVTEVGPGRVAHRRGDARVLERLDTGSRKQLDMLQL